MRLQEKVWQAVSVFLFPVPNYISQELTAALLCHIFSHVLFFFSVFIFFLPFTVVLSCRKLSLFSRSTFQGSSKWSKVRKRKVRNNHKSESSFIVWIPLDYNLEQRTVEPQELFFLSSAVSLFPWDGFLFINCYHHSSFNR